MTKAEKRVRLAYKHHAVESIAPGYFACHCGCGYVGVCRHCVPDAPVHLPWLLCEEVRRIGAVGSSTL